MTIRFPKMASVLPLGLLKTRNVTGGLGMVLCAGVVLVALLAPLLARHDYTAQKLSDALRPPFWMAGGSLDYPLGTDHLGRDMLSRLMFGARTSLLVGLGAVAISGAIGIALGLIAGFVGGVVDEVVMRFADIQLAFPPILLAVAILAVAGGSLLNVILVLGVITWVQYARVVRGSVLSIREREFVIAARVVGATNLRIVLRHILPNVLPPVFVIATVNVSAMILAEAALSFLGIGVKPPTPAWGTMLNEGREVFRTAWWNAVFPGLAITLTVLGINLVGDHVVARR